MIVGAGVIGLALARSLHKKAGGSITVVDRRDPGLEASYAAAGMLAPQAEADSPDEFFRFCRASNAIYPDFASSLMDETGVDIGFDDSGTLYLALNEHDLSELSRRYEWQSGAGLRVEHLTSDETRQVEPFVSPDTLGSLFFPEDRQVDNRELVRALVRYADLHGIEMLPECDIVEIRETAEGSAAAVSSQGQVFSAGTVVIATGAWTSLIRGAGPETGLPEIKPVRGQMAGFRTAKRLFRKVIYSARGYLVPRSDGRILAGATTEHAGFENGVTDEGIGAVVEAAYEISPSLAGLRIEEKWSGLRPYSMTERPFIGMVGSSGNIFAAVGHYRNGILLAPLTAEILAERIVTGAVGEFLESFGTNEKVLAV